MKTHSRLVVTFQNLFLSCKISQLTSEIQKHLYQLKSGKASNNVDLELLKNKNSKEPIVKPQYSCHLG